MHWQKFSHIKKRIEQKNGECDLGSRPDSNITRMEDLLMDVQRRVSTIEQNQTLIMEHSKEVRRLEKIEKNQETIILPTLENIGKTNTCSMGQITVDSRYTKLGNDRMPDVSCRNQMSGPASHSSGQLTFTNLTLKTLALTKNV